MRKPGFPLWRLFLICCLALMLPLQGMAAGAGWHCLTMAVTAAETTHAAPAADPPPCHGAGPESAGEATAPMQAPTADVAPASDSACSACAACHVASAPPSQHQGVATAAPDGSFVPARPSPSASITEAGLERPPKHLVD